MADREILQKLIHNLDTMQSSEQALEIMGRLFCHEFYLPSVFFRKTDSDTKHSNYYHFSPEIPGIREVDSLSPSWREILAKDFNLLLAQTNKGEIFHAHFPAQLLEEKREVLQLITAFVQLHLERLYSHSLEGNMDDFLGWMKNFMDNFPGIAGIMNERGKYTYLNAFAIENLHGSNWLNMKARDVFSKEQQKDLEERSRKIQEMQYTIEKDFFVDKKGRLRNFENHSFLIEAGKKKMIGVLGIDITEKTMMETRLNELAYKDSLTGINNYNYSLMKIDNLIAENQRFSLIHMDIKKFRVINEIYGYEVGDRVLIHIVNLMNRYVLKSREIHNIIMTRFKDDEFIVIYRNISKEGAVEFAKGLIGFLQQPIVINDIVYRLNLDVGIASFPDDGVIRETLIRKAGLAKNKARLNNEVHLVSFSGDLEEEIRREYELESEIHESLDKGEFELYLQPVIDVKSEKIVKAEALIRWNHKRYGMIPPNDFIPVAEKSNLILKIGEWVLEEACRILKRWEYKNVHIPIAINISGKQLLQYNFPEIVETVLRKYDVDPSKVVMEVTENYIFDEAEQVKEILDGLSRTGIRFSIDDFGTGNSSMMKLKYINFAEIKIDRSFIRGILENKTDEHLVKNIISLARDLELDVVAEGVEELRQFSFLYNLNCKYIQGYLISRPVKIREFEKLLTREFGLKKKAAREYVKSKEEIFLCEEAGDSGGLLCQLPIPVILFDKNLRILGVNQKFAHTFGVDQRSQVAMPLSKLLSRKEYLKIREYVRGEGSFLPSEEIPVAMKKDALHLDTRWAIRKHESSEEAGIRYMGMITSLRRREENLQPYAAELLENMPNSILVTDAEGHIEYINKRFTELTGFTLEDVYGKTPRILSSGLIPKDIYKNLWDTIKAGKEWQGELHNKKKNNQTYWQSVRIRPFSNEKKIVTRFIASIEDITDKKAYEKRLRYLAKIDPMTGALNRAAGMEFLELFFDEGMVSKENIAIIFMDLDNLKYINDKFGHSKGDAAIKIVADIIQKNIKKDYLFIRYGGDEFLLVIRETDAFNYNFVINRISVDLNIKSREFICPISLSFGIAKLGEVEDDTLQEMIRRADQRMYLNKSMKRMM